MHHNQGDVSLFNHCFLWVIMWMIFSCVFLFYPLPSPFGGDACRGKCSSPLPQGVPLAKRVRAVAVGAAALGFKRVSRKRWLSVPFVWG
ncbi:conserved hypothetical protein [Bacteroides sp. 3_1_23]|nr:conserved hypothetical protein [Bacteroides sp. 3_1_23]